MTEQQFVERFKDIKPDLYDYIIRRVHQKDDADDVFQDVSEKLWEKKDNFIEGSSFYCFSMGFVLNFIKKHNTNKYHRMSKECELFDAPDTRESAPEDRVYLQQMIDNTPMNTKEAMILKSHGYSLSEIASATGTQKQTVYSRLKKAKRILNSVMGVTL